MAQAADGNSLVLTNPATGNTSNGADYAASAAASGSPGGPEGLFAAWMAARGETNPLATRPGESVNNLRTYAFGVDLAGGSVSAAQPVFGTTGAGAGQQRTINFRQRLGDPGITYAIEWSTDGQAWESAAALLTGMPSTPIGDGTGQMSFRISSPRSQRRGS